MNKPRNFVKNSYHHLYNRGVNKQVIFFDNKDYIAFLNKIKKYKEKHHISILCYCLMPNHFHLFVKQLTDEYSIGKFIGDVTNSYTRASNTKYQRSGVLFEGRTKSKHIDKQTYFIWLAKYILMNPVRAKLVETPEEWIYSCALDYVGLRNGKLPDKDEILAVFSSIEEFKLFVLGKDDEFDYNLLF